MMPVAQRLRQKLLDLAIHGKLVPQCAKDEPAGELLVRIRKARVQLLTAKGIKKEDQIIPVGDDEVPFELPKEWTWCRFRELGILTGGHTPSMANPKFWNGDVLWVTSKDMKRKYIEDTGAKITALGAGELTMLEPGAVLMCTRSGILRRTFPVAIAAKELTINQDQRALTLALPEMAEYVYSALCALEPLILAKYRKTGTTVESIIWEKFIDMPFPLPPLTEQKRIVEKLNAMLKEATRVAEGTERLAQLRKKARAKILDLAIRGKLVKQEKSDEPASELLKRIAAEKAKLVAEKKIKKEKPLPPIAEDEIPFDLPKGWTWARLGSVLRVINVGIVIKPTRYYTNNDGIMAFRNSNVGEGFVDRRNWVQISHKGTEENPRCVLHEGDIAIARSGKSGVACPITKEFEGFAAIDILIATPFADFVDDEYLCFCINNSTAQRVIWGMNRGIAQSHIGATSIVNLPIPLPPLDEQRRIVAKVKEMLAASDVLKKGD